jgi:hypothetical protein
MALEAFDASPAVQAYNKALAASESSLRFEAFKCDPGVTPMDCMLKQVNMGISIDTKYILIFLVLGSLILGLVAYCVYNMAKLINGHSKQKKQIREAASPINTGEGANPLLDPINDNELPAIKDAEQLRLEEQDEFEKITKTIQDSFAQYKTYNEKLDAYYKDVKKEASPDVLDQSILKASNDNW